MLIVKLVGLRGIRKICYKNNFNDNLDENFQIKDTKNLVEEQKHYAMCGNLLFTPPEVLDQIG